MGLSLRELKNEIENAGDKTAVVSRLDLRGLKEAIESKQGIVPTSLSLRSIKDSIASMIFHVDELYFLTRSSSNPYTYNLYKTDKNAQTILWYRTWTDNHSMFTIQSDDKGNVAIYKYTLNNSGAQSSSIYRVYDTNGNLLSNSAFNDRGDGYTYGIDRYGNKYTVYWYEGLSVSVTKRDKNGKIIWSDKQLNPYGDYYIDYFEVTLDGYCFAGNSQGYTTLEPNGNENTGASRVNGRFFFVIYPETKSSTKSWIVVNGAYPPYRWYYKKLTKNTDGTFSYTTISFIDRSMPGGHSFGNSALRYMAGGGGYKWVGQDGFSTLPFSYTTLMGIAARGGTWNQQGDFWKNILGWAVSDLSS